MKIGLVILNRNEEAALAQLLPRIPRHAVDLMFAVDGNSTDASPQMLRDHGIETLAQTAMGRGEAFAMAFEHARAKKIDAVIFYGPDGNEDPADIAKFRAHLEAGAEMVIASRMMRGAKNEEDDALLRPRKWANQAFALAAWATWGLRRARLTDPINGFRAITLAAWDKLQADGPGYTIEYQCSIRAYKLGLKVVEFATLEGARIGGESGAKAIPTGLRFVRLFASEFFRGPAAT